MEMNKHHATHAINEEKLDAVSGGTGATMEIEELQPLKIETDMKAIVKDQKPEGEQDVISVEMPKGMIL